MDHDPFTVEIIRDQLIAAAEESFITLGRSSQSPIIYEVLDYACAITDSEGNLIAQANGVPGFLGTLTFAVKAVLEKHPANTLKAGDTIITNDPYAGGGNHLSDVALVAPIFWEDELIAFSVNKAHWSEVGGMAPGSWTTDSREIYQEGLQFPLIYIGRDYLLDQSLIDLIAHNVRTPEKTLGDLYAGVASLRSAERRVTDIACRYGLDVLKKSMRAIIDHGERMARMALKKLPKGKFFAEEWMDDDGLSGDPVYVCVTVTVDENEFLVDYTGSSPQVPGPINCTITRLYSAARSLFKAITDPKTPANEGWFKPVRVCCPPGTVFTARRPAPVSTYWETGAYACDLIWRALFPVLPDRLTAGHSLSVCGTIVSGSDDGATFILVEPQAGGWGAGATKDGESGLVVVGDGETYIMPVEICESRYPIMVEQYTFNVQKMGAGFVVAKQRAGSIIAKQGAGRQRGGFGLLRDYRIMCDNALLTTTFGRHKYPPWGAKGGEDGSPNGVYVFRGAHKEPSLWSGKLARYPLKRGDLVRLVTGCGGGVGLPKKRKPQDVLRDVMDDFLSVEDARDVYRVSIYSTTLEIDQMETKRLRKKNK